METLKLNKATAVKLYPTAAPEFKRMLEETFGKEQLKQKITDRVKTLEDACEVLGMPERPVFVTKTNPDELAGDLDSIAAYSKLIIITRALNEGWTPNWNDNSEYKYYPWFNIGSGSASGFSYGDYGCGCTRTDVGARLCFKSRELAEYAGKQFKDIYCELIKL